MTELITREKIVHVADKLFYQRGFEHTSFADIAEEVGISRGNFYHHFKSKDDILAAVIESRLSATRSMLREWEITGQTPLERLRCFTRILVVNQAKIRLRGCPVGTLCAELAKLDHASLPQANGLFMVFREWLCEQFRLLGSPGKADARALHVLAWSQGVATLFNAFKDERFVARELDQIDAWLDSCVGRRRAH